MDTTPSPQQGYSGQQGLSDPGSQFGVMAFIVEQLLGEVRTIVPVKVVAIIGGGVGTVPPKVDVLPLVKQMDGIGTTTSHGNVLSLPVMRWKSGNGSIIVDPVVGDIGLAVISDRDMSAVVASGAESAPGSFRRFDLADGIYLGGILGPVPTQYIAFTSTGVKVSDKNGNVIEMKAGSISITGNVTVTGSVIAGFGGADQVGVQTHLHTGNNIAPTPGT